jgi:hypothetical protein
MEAAALAILVLAPVLDEPGPLRLVAVGTGDAVVEWSLDGLPVANTTDGVAATIQAPAGEHTVTARSKATGRWTALVRPDPQGAGLQSVPAWTATWEGSAPPAPPPPVHAMGMGAAAAGGLAAAWLAVRRRRGRRAATRAGAEGSPAHAP